MRGKILNDFLILSKNSLNDLPTFIKRVLLNDISIITLLFVFLTVIFTYPIVLNMDKIPIGLDHGQYIWNFWWFKESLLELQIPTLYTDFLYYPYGVPLVFSTMSEINSLISIPFQMIFGLVKTYNMILMFTFVLSGVSTYLLVKYLTKCKTSAFISGFIFAFSPYLITRIYGGHLNMLSVGWIPLYVLYLIKMGQEPCKKNVFLASLFLSFTCLSSWQYGLFMFVFTTFYLLYHVIFDRKKILNKKNIINFSLLLLSFFIITSPFLIPRLNETIKHSYMGLEISGSEASLLSLDLLSPITPASSQSIADTYSLKPEIWWFEQFTGWENTGYIGFTVIVLMIISILIYFRYKEKKRIGFWIFSFIMFFIFALGPYLHIAGESKFTSLGFSVPLPYTLLRNYFPFFSIGRGPSRFIVLIVLSASVIVGYGLKEIFSKTSNIFKADNLKVFQRNLSKFLKPKFSKYLTRNMSKIVKLMLCLVIVSLIFIEYSPKPIPMADYPVSDFFYNMSEDEEDYAIADIPAGLEALTMYYQTIHGKKIIGGQVSRSPAMQHISMENKAMDALVWKQLDNYNATREDFISLKNMSIKYLVIHKHAFFDTEGLEMLSKIRIILDSIFESSYYEDENFLVYDIYKLN